MEEYLKSEGKCLFCGKTFTKMEVERLIRSGMGFINFIIKF